VKVEKLRSPRPSRVANAGRLADLGKGAVAVVFVEMVPAGKRRGDAGRLADAGDEPVELAVAVEVANGRTHAVLVGPHARGDSAVGECAVAVVPEQLAGAEIRSER